MNFATGRQAPRALTDKEQRELLRVTAEHKDGFRDHVVYSVAIGLGLRQHEIAMLDVGDVFGEDGKPKRVIQLRHFKGSGNADAAKRARQEVHVPDGTWYRLKKFWTWKKRRGERLDSDAPLFCSTQEDRISERSLLERFVTWQKRAGFERQHKFHSLRHTCGTNLYRKTKDIRMVMKHLRHENIQTSTIYAHPSDEDVSSSVRELPS